MTIECGSKYVCFYDESHWGLDGSSEVEREYPKDWPTWKADNSLVYDQEVYHTEEQFNALVSDKLGDSSINIFEEMASISVSGATLETLDLGDQVFTDRTNFKFNQGMPTFMEGKQYTYGKIGGGYTVTVEQSGYVILILPYTTATSGGYATLANTVTSDGWTKVLDSYYRGNEELDRFNYYVKYCEAGESFTYGKWCFYVTDK